MPSAPVLNPFANLSSAAGSAVQLTASATAGGDAVAYSATGLPSGETIDANSGQFLGSVAANAAALNGGIYNVVVKATDVADGLSSSQSFMWMVADPTAIAAIGPQTWEKGSAASLGISVTNPNNLALNYSANGLPSGLAVDSASGQISGTPDTWSNGTATITAATGNSSYSTTFNWAVVNAPTVTVPGEQWTNLNAPLTLSSAASNAISVGSAYGSAAVLNIDLSVNNGALTLAQTTGLTFITGSGTGNSAMSFSGTVANISAALDGLSYAPSSGFTGEALVSITATDAAHLDGSGNALTASDQVGIAVGGPAILTPTTQSTNSAQQLTFSSSSGNGINIVDPAAGTAGLQINLSTSNGTISLSGTSGLTLLSGTGTNDTSVSFTGSLDAVNTALDGMSYTPSSGYVGQAVLSIAATDLGTAWASGSTNATATANVEVGGPSIAVPGNQWTNTGMPKTFASANGNAVTVGDPNGSAQLLDISLSTDNGTIALAQTNGLTFTVGTGMGDTSMSFTGTVTDINSALNGLTITPANNFRGAVSLRVFADEHGSPLTQTAYGSVAVVIGGAVVAFDHSAETTLDQPVTMSPLDNAKSVAGGPMSLAILAAPTNGTATIGDDKTVTYTPNSGYYGSDSFTFQVTDSTGNTATGTVSIAIFGVEAVDDKASVAMNTATTIAVLANDVGADSIVSTTNPANGTVTVSGMAVVYTPYADFTGPDSFEYSIMDGGGHTSSATVEITVFDPNAPVATISAKDYSVTTATGTPITVDVLDQDSNYTGMPSVATDPNFGSAVVTAAGIVYTPNANFNGSDSFQYTISDSNGITATATVNVAVQPVVVQLDLNDSAEQSDDVAFLGKPLAVRVTLQAPGITDPQSITVTVQNPDGSECTRAVLVTNTDASVGDGVKSLTLTMTNNQPLELYLIATDVSAVANDIRLVADLNAVDNNNVAYKYRVGEGKCDAIDVSLGSGWKDQTGVHYNPGPGVIYSHSTPQAMVDARQYRIDPTQLTMIWIAKRGALDEGKKIYLKSFNCNDVNGSVQIRGNIDRWLPGDPNVNFAMSLSAKDFKYPEPYGDTGVTIAHDWIWGSKRYGDSLKYRVETLPGVDANGVSYSKRIGLAVVNNSSANMPTVADPNTGAISFGFSVRAIRAAYPPIKVSPAAFKPEDYKGVPDTVYDPLPIVFDTILAGLPSRQGLGHLNYAVNGNIPEPRDTFSKAEQIWANSNGNGWSIQPVAFYLGENGLRFAQANRDPNGGTGLRRGGYFEELGGPSWGARKGVFFGEEKTTSISYRDAQGDFHTTNIGKIWSAHFIIQEGYYVYKATRGGTTKYFAVNYSERARTTIHAPYGKDYADAILKLEADHPDYAIGRTIDAANLRNASFVSPENLRGFAPELKELRNFLKIGDLNVLKREYRDIEVLNPNF